MLNPPNPSAAGVEMCRLCGQLDRLQTSHLLARGFYKICRDRAGSDANPVFTTTSHARHTSQQIAEHLLCSSCEQRFRERGEDYAISVCLRDSGAFKLRSRLLTCAPLGQADGAVIVSGNAAPDVRTDALTYFAASVFWRASAHSWKTGDASLHVPLGPSTEEAFRTYLLDRGPWPSRAALWLHVTTGLDVPFVIFPYTDTINLPVGIIRFAVPGMLYDLFLGESIPRAILNHCLCPSGERTIFLADTLRSAHMKGAIRLVGESRPSQKVRRSRERFIEDIGS